MNKIIAIYGVTTSNKLGLAFNLSRYIWGKYQIDSEIINTDSRKIYKGFNISQSLPTKQFLEKVKVHLFGTVLAKKKLDLFEFQKLVKDKITNIQKRGNLPILAGGSTLYLRCILENWKEKERQRRKKISSNILILGLVLSKKELGEAIDKNISAMFRSGLYDEFNMLYKKSRKGEVAKELLEETLGYRQFLEMANVSKKSPMKLNEEDLVKVKKWIIKDILKYAYHQLLDYKRFSNIQLVRDFKQARKIVNSFF